MDSDGDEYKSDDNGSNTSFNRSLHTKSKYYKQTYRTAWEQMPDFVGWLKGVPGQPTRAFCLYCHRTLHAHRLSLLKHTCTIRHQKAAQINLRQQERQAASKASNIDTVEVTIASSSQDDGECLELQEAVTYDNNEVEVIIYKASTEGEEKGDEKDEEKDDEKDEEKDDEKDEEKDEEEEVLKKQSEKPQIRTQPVAKGKSSMSTPKPPISTHVLDTAKGQPVAGLQVSLYKLIDGRWTYINEGLTNPDGRFSNFLEEGDFTAGRYKLHFDVDRYFELRKQETLYPFIEIVFDCRAPQDHYHVPLLMSPYGYTTYRGS